jgi:hypothetical protein
VVEREREREREREPFGYAAVAVVAVVESRCGVVLVVQEPGPRLASGPPEDVVVAVLAKHDPALTKPVTRHRLRRR